MDQTEINAEALMKMDTTRTITKDDFGDLFSDVSSTDSSGINVNEDSALTLSTVWACIRAISEGVGSLPLITYKLLGDGGKERAISHRVYKLLKFQVNPFMTSDSWRKAMVTDAVRVGNAYSEIERDGSGRVIGLWKIDSSRVEPRLERGTLIYIVDGTIRLSADRIFHLKGFSTNGIVGLSPIAFARESIGVPLAAQKFGASFFGNGMRPAIVLEAEGELNAKQLDNLRASKDALHGGPGNSNKTAILEHGLKLKQLSLNNKDSQWIESRTWSVSDVCRWFRVPPVLVQDLSRATYSNVTELNRMFIKYSLAPWFTAFESEANAKLFNSNHNFFVEHLQSAFLKSELKERFESYAIARRLGVLSANEIRKLENMNKLEEEEHPGADVYLRELNLVDMDVPSQTQEVVTNNTSEVTEVTESRDYAHILDAHKDLILNLAARIVHKETQAIKRALKKDAFLVNRDAFYNRHVDHMNEVLEPVYSALIRSIDPDIQMNGEVKTFVTDYILQQKIELRDSSNVEKTIDTWEEEKPQIITDRILQLGEQNATK